MSPRPNSSSGWSAVSTESTPRSPRYWRQARAPSSSPKSRTTSQSSNRASPMRSAASPSACGFVGDDENRGAVGGGPGVGHRGRAAAHLVLVDLVLEGVAGPAGPGSLRTATLDHEVRDHAVKDEAVVEAVGRQLAEVGDRLPRRLVVELDRDGPRVGVEGCVGHYAEATVACYNGRQQGGPSATP